MSKLKVPSPNSTVIRIDLDGGFNIDVRYYAIATGEVFIDTDLSLYPVKVQQQIMNAILEAEQERRKAKTK